jgi:hypothetical protein
MRMARIEARVLQRARMEARMRMARIEARVQLRRMARMETRVRQLARMLRIMLQLRNLERKVVLWRLTHWRLITQP